MLKDRQTDTQTAILVGGDSRGSAGCGAPVFIRPCTLLSSPSAELVHTAHVITILTSMGSIFMYRTVPHSICTTPSRLLALSSRQSRFRHREYHPVLRLQGLCGALLHPSHVSPFFVLSAALHVQCVSLSSFRSDSVLFALPLSSSPSFKAGSVGCVALLAYIRFASSPGYTSSSTPLVLYALLLILLCLCAPFSVPVILCPTCATVLFPPASYVVCRVTT